MRKNVFFRISIGGDLFQSGDGKLVSAEISLSEGAGISSCSFSVRASKELVDRYFQTIYKNGLDPVILPNPDKASSSSGNASSYSGSMPSINGIDPAKILQAVNYYLGKGFTQAGAAYMVGSAIQESSLNPAASDGVAHGLFQWQGGREAGLPASFEGQLAFAITEMQSDSPASLTTLRNPSSSTNACMTAITNWERYGVEGGRFAYGAQILEALQKSKPKDAAKDSAIAAQKPVTVPAVTLPVSTGSQVTIEMGFNGAIETAYSFLHTSISYDFNKKTLTFGGNVATWILTQRVKSTAYKDCTLEQIAQKICDSHGLKLEYKGEEIKYLYFPQLGVTDYECLLLECRRVGYRMNVLGNTLKIAPRESVPMTTKSQGQTVLPTGEIIKDKSDTIADFILEYGRNLTTFTVTHSAGANSGGARSSTPSERESTGEVKFELNPDSGKLEQKRKEDKTGAGTGSTGYHTATIKPLTDGSSDEKNAKRRESELRIKGITADFTCPCESDTLLLTPDSIFKTFNISNFLDRVWVVESIAHSFTGSGFVSSGKVYSPMKNKYPPADTTSSGGGQATGKQGDPTSLRKEGGFINPTAGKAVRTSGFGQRNGKLHAGTDLAAPLGTQIYAAADGTIIDTENSCVIGDSSCGGGFGNLVFIQHTGNLSNFVTHYAHCQTGSVSVSIGQTVKQGDAIAKISDTGSSRGEHLHFEIIQGGSPVDPENFITA